MARLKRKVDKDLKRLSKVEAALAESGGNLFNLGVAGLFLLAVWAFVTLYAGGLDNKVFIIIAGVIGAYMALNIGANDVANNVGPAVGSRALTMTGALVMAALLETAGAILAGGDVVKTISKDIIDPALFADSRIFILAMTAALLSAALWINLATKVGAPVSTTHSIVGGVLGGGLAAVGFGAVNWPVMAKIAASWVISPVLGGIIAALFLAFIKYAILYRTDKIGAARRWVPVLVAIMAAAFGAYLALKGLKRIWQPGPWTVVALSAGAFAVTYAVLRPLIARRSQHLENRKRSVNGLFVIPLIFAAGLLSFAHGANDVANAVGPLAAIVAASTSGDIAAKVEIPWWVMLVGAIGITIGLALFGPKLIRRVGEQITKLNPTRAYSVALSASITVIAASALGLPVSSTHIAVGAVFGVGFFREWDFRRRKRKALAEKAADWAPEIVGAEGIDVIEDLARKTKQARKLEKAQHRRLVRRTHLLTIAAAWVVTVPFAAILSALLFWLLAAVLGR